MFINSFHDILFTGPGNLFILLKISSLVIFPVIVVLVDMCYYFQDLDLAFCDTVIQMSTFNSLILGFSS